ncbi:MBL fold metallo-hydrolase [Salibacterium salarium]|uniref:MBL fold metallo-hydrolase n=1 Tax=Salibacterium salarium TaxID=284579 RepID=A0A3R9QQI2_9BACI|nr:MBL fold metallo-hydrolase [Salibacterium salarium]RSL31150.1 MBL fold metallo-hydrolase [Salibacterium salarium]
MFIQHTIMPNLEYDNMVKVARGKMKVAGQTFQYHCYLYEGLLIDTGPPRAKNHIFTFTDNERPNQVFLTHYHEDHSGNAAFLREKFQLPIYSGPQTRSYLSQGFSMPLYRKVLWGRKVPKYRPSILNDHVIQHKSGTLLAIHTPGHSDDHYCLYDPDRKWLFSGDLFLAKKVRFGMKEDSVPRMIESLQHILTFDIQTIFCGHAGIVEKGYDALHAKLEFLLQLSENTIKLYQEGYNIQEITVQLLSKNKKIRWLTHNEFSPHFFIRSIVKETFNS